MVNELPAGRDIITHSSMSCFKSCQRKFFFQYILGIRRLAESAPLRIGKAIHAGLEALANNGSLMVALEAAMENYATAPTDAAAKLAWEYERESTAAILAAYHETAWKPESFLSVEGVFRMPIRNPETDAPTPNYVFSGRMDGIVVGESGGAFLREIKTTSDDLDPSSDYWTRLLMDQQVSGYTLAALEQGHDLIGTSYLVLRKPALRPKEIPVVDENGDPVVLDVNGDRVFTKDGKPRKTASTKDGYTAITRPETPEEFGDRIYAELTGNPEKYFACREVNRIQSEIDEFRQELWEIQKTIRQAELNGWWFRNTAACRMYNSTCQYFDVCSQRIPIQDMSDGELNELGFVRVADVHVELQ